MIGIKVKYSPLIARMRAIAGGSKARMRLRAGLEAAGMIVQSHIVKNLHGGPKTGRIYKRRSVIHRASAPGQYPASDTGNLARGIGHKIDVKGHTVIIVSTAAYAAALEYKDEADGGRPHLKRGLKETKSEVAAAIRAAMRSGVS